MSDVANAILDAAERRMRVGGYHGFSFRELAADVGVKSSSVHYHFPTKENLAAAVVRRYIDWVVDYLNDAAVDEPDPVKRWTKAFRHTLVEKRNCPAVVLGAGALDLPDEVATEVKRFYKVYLDMLVEAGLTEAAASEFLATIVGAMVMATAMGDVGQFDRATDELIREREALAA